MNLDDIDTCPGTLVKGYTTYSPICLRRVFGGKKVSHILPYNPPELSELVAEKFIENRKRISISGVQEKLSFLLQKNLLRLTTEGEQGTYILKPIPRDLDKVDQVPANEHLTMQIARQVYALYTAENALVFFENGAPAYITLRFDVRADGSKWGMEDFASIAGKTKDNAGANFKYDYSYEEVGRLIQRYIPAWRIEIEKYFSLVVFNYLMSNGDAHLKNFSILETAEGDYIMSPAYDLINTSLHVKDTGLALKLLTDNSQSPLFKSSGQPSKADFVEFGKRIGVPVQRIEKLLAPFLTRQAEVGNLIDRSFLNTSSKKTYLLSYNTKLNLLNR
jgi:serine/threonine-protein kinase HipA